MPKLENTRRNKERQEEQDEFSEEQSSRRRKAPRKNREQEKMLDDGSRRTIVAIAILGAGLLLVLSLFGAAGVIGNSLSKYAYTLFGWGTWFVPIIIWVMGVVYYRGDARHFARMSFGLMLIFLAASGLFNLVNEGVDILKVAARGDGGGYLGYAIGHPVYVGLGFWGSLAILVIALLIGAVIALDAKIEDIFDMIGSQSPNIEPETGISRVPKYPDEEDSSVAEDSVVGFEDDEDDTDVPVQRLPVRPIMSPVSVEEQKPLTTQGSARVVAFPVDLLSEGVDVATGGDVEMNKLRIKRTLENFSIPVEMSEAHVGPTVTQYTLRPADGVSVQNIVTHQSDIALSLAAQSIRIEAPIPGKSLVGIEVPNRGSATVRLRSIIDSPVYRSHKGRLPIALGKDVTGSPVVVSLEDMPHMLIAGATGSGKSVCINTLIISLMYSNSPDILKFIMVDPKHVELHSYNDIPYLIAPVITESDKTVNALKWAVSEMETRYKTLAASGARNIEKYNETMEQNKLPYIVIIIDELADLMVSLGKEVENLIVRLAQKARATGIHLVLATQRPSVDIITGVIKANISGRIAFTVNSAVDSRTILDTVGAEKLVGKGDMLYISSALPKPKRVQGAYVSDEEIQRVTGYAKTLGAPQYRDAVTEKAPSARGLNGAPADVDELYEEAKALVVRTQKASTTFVQRHLSVGYARAARLIDLLEQHGVIGPGDGAKPREVYLTQHELEQGNDGGLTDASNDGYPEPEDRQRSIE